MLVHPQFNPAAISFGPFNLGLFTLDPFAIHWYGLMYLLAFLLFLVLGKYRVKKGLYPGWTTRDIDDMLFYGVLAIIIGGRLGYVLFYKPAYYFAHPLEIFQPWHGGMSFHGGFIAVLIAVTILVRQKKRPFLEISDFIAPLIPLGLAAGRIGNFINGELWGRPTNAPWAMIFPQVDDLPRHPSQLYQFALEGVLLFVILWWFSARPKPRGAVSGLFLIGYGSFRFTVEFFRQPDSFLPPLALGLSMGQWLSLPMAIVGVAMMVWAYRRKEKTSAR
ncbi:MAG: prolipoprotein diacylglyceryl transferase [Burkholderiales bacterium]|jgi:phosphatidylglycerol:prolipoprotein diacylglycerol transferase|nr:prolipoprotein diacylglyceryl transferase [Burkholderiales bacterium]